MSGDLKWNKIMGAGLGTALAVLVLQQVSGAVFATKEPEKMGYLINVPEEAEAGATEEELPPDWGTLLPVADLAAGEAAYARCASCHTVNSGGADGIGPNLYGVVGGRVLHRPGFAYSDAMTAHAGVAPNWGYDELDQFLTAPARYVEGTKMSFAGLRDTTARVNLIAYLRSQGSAGFAVPAPDPARQPGASAPADPAAAGSEEAVAAGVDPNVPAATTGDVAPAAADTAPAGG
jgi:cytochrome c